MKAKKSRTAKTYTVNVETKRILKQRREQTLQNAKDRKSAKEYFLTASQANHKADRTSKDTQKGRKATMSQQMVIIQTPQLLLIISTILR